MTNDNISKNMYVPFLLNFFPNISIGASNPRSVGLSLYNNK